MLMKTRFWGIVSFVLSLLFGLAFAQVSRAATGPSNNIGFSVSAQLPSNQLNKDHSFFDLKMTAGQTQTLKTTIYNVTKRDMKIKTGIHTAYTNDNGVIDYVKQAKTFDPSLKYQLGRLTKLTGEKVVTVPAESSKVVEAQVKIPKTDFQGVMLGGWYFEKLDEKVTSEVQDSMNVHSQYSYVIGMKYSFGKAPNPELQLAKVGLGLKNAHQAVLSSLRNVSAVIVPNLNLETTITDKATGKVAKKEKKSNVQLAPNTVYSYPLLVGSSGLKPGDYHLQMTVKNKAHHWKFEKDFTITPAAVKKYKHQSVENSGISPIWLVLWGAIGMLIVVGLVLWFFYFLKRRTHTK
ncbi:DUF916 and DUF3324 domain-containing protein [Lactiplantibacillus daoliensis]|uniref:DUF916 and DUF3324 domain-containing protein n=1 Tax=Lactiplantibacillus daoliensis TaxID=2559916 RepID=A0ABW1UCB1_9LACO|nr:DUF916 and DUF3324 domain-containing protein [Lactiplantibacillus daoliensis]